MINPSWACLSDENVESALAELNKICQSINDGACLVYAMGGLGADVVKDVSTLAEVVWHGRVGSGLGWWLSRLIPSHSVLLRSHVKDLSRWLDELGESTLLGFYALPPDLQTKFVQAVKSRRPLMELTSMVRECATCSYIELDLNATQCTTGTAGIICLRSFK